jgi:hypothetical protein
MFCYFERSDQSFVCVVPHPCNCNCIGLFSSIASTGEFWIGGRIEVCYSGVPGGHDLPHHMRNLPINCWYVDSSAVARMYL